MFKRIIATDILTKFRHRIQTRASHADPFILVFSRITSTSASASIAGITLLGFTSFVLLHQLLPRIFQHRGVEVIVYVILPIVIFTLIVPQSEAVPPLVMLLLLEAIVVRSRLEILLTLPITVVVKLPPLLWAFLVINRGTPVATLVLLLLVVLLLVLLLLLSVSVSVVKSPLPWEHILGLCRVVVSLVGTGSTVPLLLWGAKAQRQEAAVRAGV